MDNLFKGLDGFETKDNLVPTDWNALEKQLNKKRKKDLFWFGTSFFALLLVSTGGFAMWNSTLSSKEPEMAMHKTFEHKKGGKQLKENDENARNHHSGQAVLANDSGESLQHNYSSNKKPSSAVKRNSQALNTTSVASEIFNTNFSSSINGKAPSNESLPAINYKDIDEDKNSNINTLALLEFEGFNVINVDRVSFKETNSEEKNEKPFVKNTFNLYGGIKTSSVNKLSPNDKFPYVFETGAFVQLDYSIRRHLGVSLRFGIDTEFGHDLNYSYVSERKTFLHRSDKISNVTMNQVTSSNLHLNFNYRWTEKLVTSIGGYYNFPFLTSSHITESGTGLFASIDNEKNKVKGYRDLLNSNEFGLSFTQTYRPFDGWGIALGVQSGLSNRLNNSYFLEGASIKRTEFSLMLTKRIK